jgi:hypothetical protein
MREECRWYSLENDISSIKTQNYLAVIQQVTNKMRIFSLFLNQVGECLDRKISFAAAFEMDVL